MILVIQGAFGYLVIFSIYSKIMREKINQNKQIIKITEKRIKTAALMYKVAVHE